MSTELGLNKRNVFFTMLLLLIHRWEVKKSSFEIYKKKKVYILRIILILTLTGDTGYR